MSEAPVWGPPVKKLLFRFAFVYLRLTKSPEFLLVTRGFHWINERPLKS